jgi:NAD(P) transhydrogenase subunit beta
MNVLLAEANVPYAAAKNDKASPIYGMPILNVDQAKAVIVMKRSMNPGFAGIENELFYDAKTSMLFGDAKASLGKLVTEMKNV